MISREKVITGLRYCSDPHTTVCYECPYHDEFMGCSVLARDALELLNEQDWHLITEDSDGLLHGLPGDDGQYLMTDGKDIWIDDYVDGVADGIILDSGKDIRDIVAWMHMPELPKLNRR